MDAINPLSGANGYSPLTSVSGAGASSPAPVPGSSAPQASDPDTFQISAQGSKAAQHVQQARVLPPLDDATVKRLKEAIAQGQYPAPVLVYGLAALIGNNLATEER